MLDSRGLVFEAATDLDDDKRPFALRPQPSWPRYGFEPGRAVRPGGGRPAA